MNKFYYVPVTSRHIFYDDKKLLDVTGTIDFLLKDRELGRVEMLYGDKTRDSSSLEMKQVLSHYNSETSLLFRDKAMPQRLILIQDKDGLREIYTDEKLSIKIDPSYLDCYKIKAVDAVALIEDETYFELAYNYFSMYKYRKSKKNKSLTKKS